MLDLGNNLLMKGYLEHVQLVRKQLSHSVLSNLA